MPDIVIPEYRVTTDRLRVGVFVRLEGVKWHEHPLFFKNFKIANNEQLQTLQSMETREVICVPGKSDVLPLNDCVHKEKASRNVG